MKFFKVFLSALMIGLGMSLAAPVLAQQTQVTDNGDGSYTVTLADGSQQSIPADIAAQVQAAVAGQTGVDVATAIRDLVAANPNLTLAIVALGTVQRPAAANAIAFGAIWANPDAGDDIVAAATGVGGNLRQTIVAFAKTGAGAQGVRGRAQIVAIEVEDGDDTVVDSDNPSITVEPGDTSPVT